MCLVVFLQLGMTFAKHAVVVHLTLCFAVRESTRMTGNTNSQPNMSVVTMTCRSGCSRLQGRPVPCRLVHWHVAEMQPPMVDSLDKLLELSRSVGDQEAAVNQHAQQLLEVSGAEAICAYLHFEAALLECTCIHHIHSHVCYMSGSCDATSCVLQMQQVLITDVTAVTETAAAAPQLVRQLADLLQDCASQQNKVQACKASPTCYMLETACCHAYHVYHQTVQHKKTGACTSTDVNIVL